MFEKLPELKSKPKLESVNPLKSEHLKQGVRPIMACVGTVEQFIEEDKDLEDPLLNIRNKFSNPNNIDYYGQHEELINQGFKNAKYQSYVISSLDNSDKFSKSFKNCTGIIVTGISKDTNENISFLSHQDPRYFLVNRKKKKSFLEDLKEQLISLKEVSIKGTIDAVIVGGNYFKEEWAGKYRRDYLNSIKLLSTEVKNVLGFEPVVTVGPKTIKGRADDIFYDNNNRRLYIIRPEVDSPSAESFLPKDIKKQAKKW